MFNIISKFKTIGIVIAGVFSLILWGRNSSLSKENHRLSQENENKDKKLKINKKVKHALKRASPTDIAGNIQRMRKDKL